MHVLPTQLILFYGSQNEDFALYNVNQFVLKTEEWVC